MCRDGSNYIYIHIFKCGGTSVHNALQQLDGSSKMLKGGHLDIECIRKYHEDNNIMDQFDKKFKFCVVRNPYDWLASTYHYIRRAKGHGENKRMMESTIDQFVDWFIDEAMNFEREEFQNKYLTQKQFITKDRKIDGEVLVDYWTRIEDINDNWEYILSQIGLPYKALGMKNKNPNKRSSYRDEFGKDAVKRIQETFKVDFDYFGYEQ